MKRYLLAALAVAAALSGTAYASGVVSSIVGPDGTINGCYRTKGAEDSSKGQLRVIAAGEACKRNELAVRWSEQGPKGDRGLPGATGEAGPAGNNGIDGRPGTNGTNGAPGPTGAQGPPGAPGIAGPTGDPGSAGPQGPRGDVGSIGPLGAAGPAGPAGSAGIPARWLRVSSAGAILATDGGFSPSLVSEGTYLIGVSLGAVAGRFVGDCAFVTTPHLDSVSINVAAINTGLLRVQTWKGYDIFGDPVLDSAGFSLALFCPFAS